MPFISIFIYVFFLWFAHGLLHLQHLRWIAVDIFYFERRVLVTIFSRFELFSQLEISLFDCGTRAPVPTISNLIFFGRFVRRIVVQRLEHGTLEITVIPAMWRVFKSVFNLCKEKCLHITYRCWCMKWQRSKKWFYNLNHSMLC